MPLSNIVLEARGVSKHYRLGEVGVPALTSIDLRVAQGDFLAIAGSSGSGKTTLLNLLGCIDRPTEGKILVDGKDTDTLGSDELSRLRAEKIGFVFQTFNLIPVLTAAENVEYPLLLLAHTRGDRERRVAEAIGKVGLERFALHRPDQLSGGQRQRVAIARAMVKHPHVVLADEPTANLDKHTALTIIELMHELNRSEGVTFVFSSHDPLILSRASRVVYLSDGRQIAGPEDGHAT
jgi:putative ABC transport system ATP-binding protein